ncbi:hypothetical protein LguiA_003753 [Lonicera macranthoides]
MSSIVSKNKHKLASSDQDRINTESSSHISSHIYLKPAHSSEPLDKEVVLRRIRQKRRANKFRASVQALFGSFLASKTDNNESNGNGKVVSSVDEKKWVDDAFASP